MASWTYLPLTSGSIHQHECQPGFRDCGRWPWSPPSGTSPGNSNSTWQTFLGLAAVSKSCEGNWKTSLLCPPVTSSKVQEKSISKEGIKPMPSAGLLNRAKFSDGLPKTSPLLKLSPMVDNDGLIRVGGRLQRASLSYEGSHPLDLPSSHHEKVQHQGWHLTLGLIRSSGFWIVESKRAVNSSITTASSARS